MSTITYTFSDAYGSVGICIIFAGVLNGFLASQMISYFRNYSRDPVMLKASIALIWYVFAFSGGWVYSRAANPRAATSASFGCSSWVLYVLTISQHQVPLIGISIPSGFSAAIALDIIVHCMTQGIYIYRMFKFSRQIWLLVPCCTLLLFEFGLGLVWTAGSAPLKSGISIAMWSETFRWMIDTLFSTSALLDVIITVSICYQLKQNRISGLKRTKHLIDTLTRWTIQSGLLTCLVAIAVLIAWTTDPTSNLWLGLSICLTDCYAMMLMALLNGRMRLRNNIDHVSLSSIRIMGANTDSTSDSSQPPDPALKIKPSNLAVGTRAEEPGPRS